jgi:hypothetical protein
MADDNGNGNDNGVAEAPDRFDEDERAAIEAAVQRHMRAHNVQQAPPRQLPPPPQAPLLNKMADNIQKKDKQERK